MHTRAVSEVARRGRKIPESELQMVGCKVTLWVLGIELRIPGRAAVLLTAESSLQSLASIPDPLLLCLTDPDLHLLTVFFCGELSRRPCFTVKTIKDERQGPSVSSFSRLHPPFLTLLPYSTSSRCTPFVPLDHTRNDSAVGHLHLQDPDTWNVL